MLLLTAPARFEDKVTSTARNLGVERDATRYH